MRSALALAVLVAAAVLGFGYWHLGTHATLFVQLRDKARADGKVLDAKLVFYDIAGKPLARAKSDNTHGVVWPRNPISGYCGPDLSGDTFHACFDIESIWLMDWVAQTRLAELQVGACNIRDIQIDVKTHRDNPWLWWLPLPHAGGMPRINYSFDITIDSRECRKL